MADVQNVSLDQIVVDPILQPRVGGLDEAHVRALQEVAENLPPLVVVQQGNNYLLVDGFHRYAAYQNLGRATIPVRIIAVPADGDVRALAFALNAVHGRPLTATDRRAEGERLLRANPAGSNLEASRRTGLSPSTVAAIREQLESAAVIGPAPERIGADGRRYPVSAPDGAPRQPGALPEKGIASLLGDAVGRLFTPAERRHQRAITTYLERLAVALEDQEDLDGWERPEQAAEACSLVLGDERSAALGERLGWTSRTVLDVAVALGYADGELIP